QTSLPKPIFDMLARRINESWVSKVVPRWCNATWSLLSKLSANLKLRSDTIHGMRSFRSCTPTSGFWLTRYRLNSIKWMYLFLWSSTPSWSPNTPISEDQRVLGEQGRAEMVQCHLELAVEAVGKPKIAIRHYPRHAVIQVVHPDIRFLVDSVSAELNKMDVPISVVVHPIVVAQHADLGGSTSPG